MNRLMTVILTLTLALSCSTIPLALAPAHCPVRAAIVRGPNALGQYLLYIQTADSCSSVGRMTRILTARGGTLPPLGYFKLGKGAPLAVKYWVFEGARVQEMTAPNVWREVRITRAAW